MERHLRLFAVHRAAFVFQKNFQSMQLESEIPNHRQLFFFLPLCASALFVCSTPNPPRNYRVPLFSTLSRPSFRNCCVKRQDCLLETTFIHQRDVLCFLGWRNGCIIIPSCVRMDGGGSTFLHWDINLMQISWAFKGHDGYDEPGESLLHNMDKGR